MADGYIGRRGALCRKLIAAPLQAGYGLRPRGSEGNHVLAVRPHQIRRATLQKLVRPPDGPRDGFDDSGVIEIPAFLGKMILLAFLRQIRRATFRKSVRPPGGPRDGFEAPGVIEIPVFLAKKILRFSAKSVARLYGNR